MEPREKLHTTSLKPKWLVISVFLFFITGGTCVSLKNVALNKPANQSSSTGASRAVDGNTNQHASAGSCTVTHHEYEPFWEVDLLEVYMIEQVTIYRMDTCCTPHEPIYVHVSNDHDSYTYVNHVWTTEGFILLAVPRNPVPGRWVKLTVLSTHANLRLCEVKVMSAWKYHTEWFEVMTSVQGSGSILDSKSVISEFQCAFHCRLNQFCLSFNIRRNNIITSSLNITSSPEMECQLLDAFSYDESLVPSTDVTFYSTGKMS